MIVIYSMSVSLILLDNCLYLTDEPASCCYKAVQGKNEMVQTLNVEDSA